MSQTKVELLAAPDKPEYAFIGRSNVGKSSLINMLMNNSKLAKDSSASGETQSIDHLEIDGQWYLVDLPGYGYAKTAKTDRASWKIMIDDYMNNLGEQGIPFVIVYTKADKVGKVSFQKNVKAITNGLLEFWEELPQQFITSSETAIGQAEILKFIEETNRLF